jgi:DNA-3-methyladenine glycosylase
MILPSSFYQRDDVVFIAKELVGKQLFSRIGNVLTGGIIIETEAYRGPDDRACHAFNHRRTPRTEVMFRDGGIAYVYLCYGMHNMLNVVTATSGMPHAVLIRALFPTHGVEVMQKRRNGRPLTNGPGSLCQALGITREHNSLSLQGPLIWIQEPDHSIDLGETKATLRIGVDYAGADALLPWRFVVETRPQKGYTQTA